MKTLDEMLFSKAKADCSRNLKDKLKETSCLQIRVCIGNLFSLLLIQNICCGYSKELSQMRRFF